MPEPGDLVESPDYAFAFRLLQPEPSRPTSLLVLLHGVGGDESQLASIGAAMPDGTVVALPRGIRTIGGERLGWFRVGLGGDEPQVVEDEAEEARTRLVDFVRALQHRFDVPPSRTVLCGFSQGGVLAATVALTEPECVGAFAMLSGRLMPEYAERIAPDPRLAHLEALVVHGRADETLPVDGAQAAHRRLDEARIAAEIRLYDAGHEMTHAMRADTTHWLQALLARPPAPAS
ncbi:alpha/beta hydrolase [Lysobacter xanthus]